MGNASAERIQKNNETFREANERISKRAQQLGADLDRIPFICECPVEDCVEILHLTPAEYSDIRADPHRYMTANGHESREQPVGQVVARHDGYVVIEKHGDG